MIMEFTFGPPRLDYPIYYPISNNIHLFLESAFGSRAVANAICTLQSVLRIRDRVITCNKSLLERRFKRSQVGLV
jgi:hypothetical protein